MEMMRPRKSKRLRSLSPPKAFHAADFIAEGLKYREAGQKQPRLGAEYRGRVRNFVRNQGHSMYETDQVAPWLIEGNEVGTRNEHGERMALCIGCETSGLQCDNGVQCANCLDRGVSCVRSDLEEQGLDVVQERIDAMSKQKVPTYGPEATESIGQVQAQGEKEGEKRKRKRRRGGRKRERKAGGQEKEKKAEREAIPAE